MTGKFKTLLLFIISMCVIFTAGFAFNAYANASTTIPTRGGHAESRISGYTIDITIELSQENPERIAALILEVSDPMGEDVLDSIYISSDDGDTWLQCEFLWDQSWKCIFSPGCEPLVVETNKIIVSTGG
jgi:hypothetical protein